MANTLSQIGAVTAMNIRNIPERWASSLVAVVGIAGVTLVLIAVLSIAAGFRKALELSGSQDVAVILRSGATNEMSSGFGQEQVTVIRDAPGDQARRATSRSCPPSCTCSPKASSRTRTRARTCRSAACRQSAPQLRKSFKIDKGKMMREGTNEIIVGKGVVANYENIDVGKTVRWGNANWEIVGIFSDDGGVAESEAWGDARLVQQVWNRGTSFQSVRVRLADASDATFKKFKDTLTKDPRVQVAIQREPQFYAEQQQLMSTLIKGAGVTSSPS